MIEWGYSVIYIYMESLGDKSAGEMDPSGEARQVAIGEMHL